MTPLTDEGSYDFCRAFLCQRRPHLDGRAIQHGGRMYDVR